VNVTDEEGTWISDEDAEILRAAKEGAYGTIETETPPAHMGREPVYLEGTVDAQLADLRDAGDAANYERVREQAMQAALDRGDEAEFQRIAEHHRPAGQPQYKVFTEPEPTEEELVNLQEIFSNPNYQAEMAATDGSPEQVAKVYDKFGVPKEARLTFEPKQEPSGAPLYGQVSR
jgi:hypothetical protein